MTRKPRAEQKVAEQDKFILRLPAGMREHLKAEAKANGHSMNAEIIARLSGNSQLDRIEAAIERLCPAAEAAEVDGGPRGKRVPIMFSDAEIAAVDGWRSRNRVLTRARAIRSLVAAAIAQAEKA